MPYPPKGAKRPPIKGLGPKGPSVAKSKPPPTGGSNPPVHRLVDQDQDSMSMDHQLTVYGIGQTCYRTERRRSLRNHRLGLPRPLNRFE